MKLYDVTTDEMIEATQDKLDELSRGVQILARLRRVTFLINQLAINRANSDDTFEKLKKIESVLLGS